ncbi:MFS transporter [Tistrella mobilis]|uniref:MFS transporter n=1 Tax=Tistrella mobilis TaxID=171437 RepID=UPI0035568D34
MIAVMCLCEVLSMAAYGCYPALLPLLRDDWGLSNGTAGWISSAFFVGYVAAVPVLTGATDRVDARRVYIGSLTLIALATLGFGSFATGPLSAGLFQALAGAGFAGSYMPGLKILSDHVRGPKASRAVASYTACFSLGAGLSVWLAGLVAAAGGWQAGFWSAGALAATALVLALIAVPATPPPAPAAGIRHRPWWMPPDFRPVLRNRRAIAYTLAYAGHCWEMFGLRSWLVAFLVHAGAAAAWASSLGGAIIASGILTSFFGNEMAMRLGRRRWITVAMSVTAVLAGVTAAVAGAPLALVLVVVAVYNLMVMADSASLTAGAVAESDPSVRGAAMAMHALLGFGGAILSPITFGLALDGAGGDGDPLGWAAGFAVLALGGLAGLAAFRRIGGGGPPPTVTISRGDGGNG